MTKNNLHKKRVLFLDIDGPVCTERAYYAYGQDKNKHVLRAWDPLSIKLISRLCEDYSLSVVISSTWRQLHDVPTILLSHGFNGEFHKDDKTEKIKMYSGRNDEIVDWLNKHQEVEIFLVIDDEESGDSLKHNSPLRQNTIFVDVREGFLYKDYLKAKNILNQQINLFENNKK